MPKFTLISRARAAFRVFIVLAGAIPAVSCVGDTWESLVTFDADTLRPPRLEKVSEEGGAVLEARFDKAAWVEPAFLAVYPDLEISAVEDGSSLVRLTLAAPGQPGKRYTLELTVRDERGNTSSYLYHFYGYNPRVPAMLINEVIVNTPSTTIYNLVEIFLLSGGNMAGVTLFQGTKSYPDISFTFPQREVQKGEYILVHFNTAGAAGEIDETGASKTEASGKGASPTAWDFWLPGSGNLSRDNNVISLYTNPDGALIDALVYTSRKYEPGARYNGFGTGRMQDKVLEVVAEGGWVIQGEEPFPDDGFDPTGATSTRSICRDSKSTNTKSAADWHIVPSGQRTPGAVNSDAVY
ncbi:MAG: hypothetical protein FWG35_00865 [Spirochaetaceae bacterium]|nr:hypothetical protein [Spirochaetaceae bacterium]